MVFCTMMVSVSAETSLMSVLFADDPSGCKRVDAPSGFILDVLVERFKLLYKLLQVSFMRYYYYVVMWL